MISNVILTIGAMFFELLLIITYFSQQRYQSIRNKLYRYSLINVFLILLFEIVYAIISYYSSNIHLKLFAGKLYWATGIPYFTIVYLYVVVFVSNIKINSLKELLSISKSAYRLSMFSIIIYIIYFFLPMDVELVSSIDFIPGPAAYWVVVTCSFIVFLEFVYWFNHRKETTVKKMSAIFLLVSEAAFIITLSFVYRTVGLIGLATSITNYILYFFVENPDLQNAEELLETKESIDKANRAKTDFLSNMSHEVRSPMNAIVGFSESILSSSNYDEEEARADINNIYSSSSTLLDIVNNILNISKIESGEDKLEEKEYNLKNMISTLIDITKTRIGYKNIQVLLDVDPNLPVELYGDGLKLRSVLLNLLTNAAKYTEVGKIKLSITGEVEGNYVNYHFKVSDTGYGIKKEDYDKLFVKFSRLDDATKNSIEGTGLGMVITKKYVDLLGGTIKFDSEYEVGTTFYVDLKQRKISDRTFEDSLSTTNSSKDIKVIDCSEYRILMVEDDPLNVSVTKKLLSKYNFKIDNVGLAKECITKIKTDIHYDLILLDIVLPDMNGVELLHILKKFDLFDIPPVVALTANAVTGMRESYLNEGFDDYISKPINSSELNRVILYYFDK